LNSKGKSTAVERVGDNRPVVGVDMSLTKDDIVAVGVAAQERKLKQLHTRLGAELESARKRYQKTEKEIDKRLKKVANAMFRTDKISDAFEDAGFTGIKSKIEHEYNKETGILRVTCSITQDSYHRSYCISKTKEKDVQDEVEGLNKRLEEQAEETEDVSERYMMAAKALRDIDSTERQMKAVLASRALSESVEGQELLDALQGAVEIPPQLLT